MGHLELVGTVWRCFRPFTLLPTVAVRSEQEWQSLLFAESGIRRVPSVQKRAISMPPLRQAVLREHYTVRNKS